MCASVAALFAAVWIVCPAPAYNLWLLAVVASEWSLWFGVLAAFGVVCGLVARRMNAPAWAWRVAIACGSLAIVLSLVPLLTSLPDAGEHGVSLSLAEYVAGSMYAADGLNFTTHTFAVVDGNRLELDVYAPPIGVQPNGAGVIVVHGGSWNAGRRSDFPVWNQWLAAQGFTVFDVDYRLAPQPNWQTATADVRQAVAWVAEHAAGFRVDASRLALVGRSAGGHLALLAAYAGEAAPVCAVVAFYAPTDLLWSYDNPANERVIDGPVTLRRFVGGSPHDSDEMRERFSQASPIAHVTSRTTPTLLIHGGRDQLVREENARRLANRLSDAGVTHETVFIPYAQHGFDYNFRGWGAQIVRPVMLDFLHARCGSSRRAEQD